MITMRVHKREHLESRVRLVSHCSHKCNYSLHTQCFIHAEKTPVDKATFENSQDHPKRRLLRRVTDEMKANKATYQEVQDAQLNAIIGLHTVGDQPDEYHESAASGTEYSDHGGNTDANEDDLSPDGEDSMLATPAKSSKIPRASKKDRKGKGKATKKGKAAIVDSSTRPGKRQADTSVKSVCKVFRSSISCSLPVNPQLCQRRCQKVQDYHWWIGSELERERPQETHEWIIPGPCNGNQRRRQPRGCLRRH